MATATLRMMARAASAGSHGVRALSTTAIPQASVGFIGLGNMGAHMARNLVKDGHSVSVFDINQDSVDSLTASGATAAATPAEAAAGVDTLVTMLPSSPHVDSVFNGPDGILSNDVLPGLCIDSSTIDPAMSQKVAAQVEDRGSTFVDAPVSGGVGGAEAGTLTFMVGGAEEVFKSALPLLEVMGGNIVHCGAVGTGQAAKICNNMMLAISMIGTSETMNLGVRLGIDPKLLAGIINTSSGASWSCGTYNPVPGVIDGVPSSNDYNGGFGSALMLKDVGLALDAAKSQGAATPLGSLAGEVYTASCDAGYAEKDFSSAYAFLQEKSKWNPDPK